MKIYKFKYLFLILLAGFFSVACEEYLDEAPEAEITKEDVFKKLDTYQGFVDNIYQGVVDVTTGRWNLMNYNYGDDVHTGRGSSLSTQFDNGNSWYWADRQFSVFNSWKTENSNYLYTDNVRGVWNSGWLNIRNANLALQNIDLLAEGTQEDKDILLGQAYFFRGYFHFEILRAWGGIPYIDTVLTASQDLNYPRLSYLETAEKVAEDMKKAAQMLPNDWDQTTIGQPNIGQNKGRATKAAAWGYLGKNYLYAASPLMNGLITGNYEYNQDLSKKAIEAFQEVFALEDQGYVGLVSWDRYSDNFYKIDRTAPLTEETIFNNPVYAHKASVRGEHLLNGLGGWSCFAGPTQNYVEYFGMANGLPINDPTSGFDPADPWSNRDPRFYYNIELDGDKLVQTNPNHNDAIAQFYIGGRHRSINGNQSTTGYGQKKYKHPTINNPDRGWAGGRYFYEVPQMRLADIYLMYAEAANEVYGPTGAVPNGITALEAINIIRNRANVPDVEPQHYIDKETFRETIRRERAVELAFESHRWYDLRRWYVAHLPQYTEKYALEFDKEHTYFKKNLIVDRVFEDRHYWLPFPNDNVTLYPEFYQNPGW